MKFPVQYDAFRIDSIANPRWGDKAKTMIDVDLTVTYRGSDPDSDGEQVTMPYTSITGDTFAPYCEDIWTYVSGLSIGEWVRPEVTVEDLQAQFDLIWPDVMLGLADQDTIDLAKNLRIQIKAMQA